MDNRRCFEGLVPVLEVQNNGINIDPKTKEQKNLSYDTPTPFSPPSRYSPYPILNGTQNTHFLSGLTSPTKWPPGNLDSSPQRVPHSPSGSLVSSPSDKSPGKPQNRQLRIGPNGSLLPPVNGVGSSMSGGLPGYKPQHLLTGHNIADIVAMFDANLLKDINVIEIFAKIEGVQVNNLLTTFYARDLISNKISPTGPTPSIFCLYYAMDVPFQRLNPGSETYRLLGTLRSGKSFPFGVNHVNTQVYPEIEFLVWKIRKAIVYEKEMIDLVYDKKNN